MYADIPRLVAQNEWARLCVESSMATAAGYQVSPAPVGYVVETPKHETCFAFSEQFNAYHVTAPPSLQIEPGVYSPVNTDRYGVVLARQGEMNHDAPFKTTSKVYDEVQADMQRFWSLGESYRSAGKIHKRGVLLHGPAGTGKTHLVYREAERVISMGGIAVLLAHGYYMTWWAELAPKLRAAFPDLPVCVVIEEIDSVSGDYESAMLSFLDGPSQIGNCIVIATTNNINDIRYAIKDRPGRFDRTYHIGYPDDATRGGYISELSERLGADIDVDFITSKTNGMSVAHIKEIVLSMHLYGYSLEDILDHLDLMRKVKDTNGEAMRLAGFSVNGSHS